MPRGRLAVTTIREDTGSGGMRARTSLKGEGWSRLLADAKLEERVPQR